MNTPPVPSISRCIHIVYWHKNVWEYQWSNFIYNCMSTFLHYVHCKDALLDCSAPGGEMCESLTWVDEIDAWCQIFYKQPVSKFMLSKFSSQNIRCSIKCNVVSQKLKSKNLPPIWYGLFIYIYIYICIVKFTIKVLKPEIWSWECPWKVLSFDSSESVGTMGWSQLSNPSDLPCLFSCKMIKQNQLENHLVFSCHFCEAPFLLVKHTVTWITWNWHSYCCWFHCEDTESKK